MSVAREEGEQILALAANQLLRAVLGAVAAILLGLLAWAPSAGADPADYGFVTSSVDLSTTQAGAHPDVQLSFELKTDPATMADFKGDHQPYASTKDLGVELPPGLIGNPNNLDECSPEQFESSTTRIGDGCSLGSQVGVVELNLWPLQSTLIEPIYNLTPPNEDVVARLGFYAGVLPNYVNISVRSESDFGLTASIEGVPSTEGLVKATTILWGVPADSSHNTLRLTPEEAFPNFRTESPPRASGVEPAPFMTNPTSCGSPGAVVTKANSYELPSLVAESTATIPEITGCGQVDFDPSLTLATTTREASAPAGLDATLTIPQNEAVDDLGTSQLQDAFVDLPLGLSIATNAADGLAACSADEVGYRENVESACPEAAKIGAAEFDVPALSRILKGSIYQRTPEPGNLFRIWLVSDELGLHVKIPGEIQTDPITGQVKSVFVDTPEVPVEELKLHFKGGPRGVLITPSSCGTYFADWRFEPWSGGPPKTGQSPMTIDQGCDTGGFAPGFTAGSTNASAGSFTHFVVDLTRNDGEQNISAVDMTLPRGLLAKIKGVPLCDGPAATTGECSPASQVGSVAVAAGAGSNPLWVPQPGKAPTAMYLSGPYKGGPYSLVIKVPAQAGPFDLGTVVTRAAIYVHPETAQVSVKSDPLPQILEGVPIFYRTVHVDVNRPEFLLNPTSCKPDTVGGSVLSTGGTSAAVGSPFQVGSCASLPFKPALSLQMKGSMKRTKFPKLKAVLKARAGDANIAKTAVTLPHSQFLEQSHIGTVCTRVQFNADQCPEKSIYGFARATSPLLDEPLQGPVYLRSNGGDRNLPDLVAALKGQIDINVVGYIDSVRARLRTRFVTLPDAPVSKFVLEMRGGKKGLLVNSENLCGGNNQTLVKMTGQNGRAYETKPNLKTSCGKKSAGR